MPSPEIHPLTVQLLEHADRADAGTVAILDRLQAAGVQLDTAAPGLVTEFAVIRAEDAARLTVGDAARTIALETGERVQLPRLDSLTDEPAILTSATTAAAGDPDNARMRLPRLVRAVVTQAAQDGRAETIRNAKTVEGWTRGVDSNSCELCRWWWRDGRVWPKTHHMPTHPGCTCVQVPATEVQSRVFISRRAGIDSDYRAELAARGALAERFGKGRVTR